GLFQAQSHSCRSRRGEHTHNCWMVSTQYGRPQDVIQLPIDFPQGLTQSLVLIQEHPLLHSNDHLQVVDALSRGLEPSFKLMDEDVEIFDGVGVSLGLC